MIQKWIKEIALLPVDDSGQVPDVCLIEVVALTFLSILLYTILLRSGGLLVILSQWFF